MTHVLLNAAAFILVIIIGRFLAARRLLPANAGETLKSIVMNITLPAAIIMNFSKTGSSSGGVMLSLAALGLLVNVIMVGVGMALTRRRSSADEALYMLSLPAMNIGAFCIPFIQSFLPALGTVAASMFDVGNSIACTGGTYAFTSEYVRRSGNSSSSFLSSINWRMFGRRLVTSTPLMTYIIMFALTTGGVHLPSEVFTLIAPLSVANPCIALLMIGVMIRIEFKREYMKDVAVILGLRHLFSVALALVCYFVLPFDLVIRQALVLVAFAPLSVIAPAYVGMCDGDEGKASAINSFSIILSVAEITGLLVVMGLN
ncbi:AEC family transporter [Alloscardovia macacae]|uniref:Transporter auxin efflux carrier family protein n=1 Tax=Alloscardovia macacae TaxID=1160091 RepID=A0A261F3R2_9BIFI|nr:hypothetical protein [Alloscardovia macacae]OZG53715.1 transporter auxin efflux carrier family protein [Alloscardovia macacae]